MRMLLRSVSALALSVAVVAGVLDTIQSFASSQVVLTPLFALWDAVNPASLDLVSAAAADTDPAWRIADALEWTLSQPAFAVFLTLALLMWMAGYRRPKPAGRFSA